MVNIHQCQQIPDYMSETQQSNDCFQTRAKSVNLSHVSVNLHFSQRQRQALYRPWLDFRNRCALLQVLALLKGNHIWSPFMFHLPVLNV